MNDLQIRRSDGIEDFEAYLAKSATFQKTLVLPNDLDEGGGIGTSVAFCQFLLTWARRAKNRDIKTFLLSDDNEAFTKFTGRVHGLCAAYISKRLIAISVKGQKDDIRFQVLRAAKPRIDAMSQGRFQEAGRGREVEFIFVQDAKSEFHGSLYSKVPTPLELQDRQKHGELIRSVRELNRLLELCFDHLRITQFLKKQIMRSDYVFGELLSEIFHNASEHGYLDIHGGRLDLNLRCIRIAVTEIARGKLAQKSISSPEARLAANQYFNKMAELKGEYARETVRILELSVFDSGPGFAATIEGREVPNAEEARKAVARCFLKHQSAKSSPKAGHGLVKVLSLLSELGGFVRIRTATVEAFYGAVPGERMNADPNLFVHGGLPSVEGSVVTVCIPITY